MPVNSSHQADDKMQEEESASFTPAITIHTSTPPSLNPIAGTIQHPPATIHQPSPAAIEAQRLYSIRITAYLTNTERSVPPFKDDCSHASRMADLGKMKNKLDAWSSVIDKGVA